MAVSFGELLGGAGRIGTAAQEAGQRLRDYERDREALAQMRRLEQFRREQQQQTIPEARQFQWLEQEFPVAEAPAPVAPKPQITPATQPTTQPATQPAATPEVEPTPEVIARPLKQEPEIAAIPLTTAEQRKQLQDRLAILKLRRRGTAGAGGMTMTPAQKEQLERDIADVESKLAAPEAQPTAEEVDQQTLKDAERKLFALTRQTLRSPAEEQERIRLQGIVQDLQARMRRARQSKPAAPEAPKDDLDRLIDAQIKFESGGKAGARSKAGAIGLGQALIPTSMKPGYGAVDIFTIADQLGVKYRNKTKGSAEELLNNGKVNRAFSKQYIAALIDHFRDYKDATAIALAAYNWGPGNVTEWLHYGSDPNKLPVETREYVDNVLSEYRGERTYAFTDAAGAAVLAKGVSTPSVGVTATPMLDEEVVTGVRPAQEPPPAEESAPVAQSPATPQANYYLANPQAVTEDMRRVTRQRDELVRLAQMYQRSGLGNEFSQVRAQIIALDESMIYLHGMQGMQELTFANDPRRLAGVWSAFTGQNVAIQPRADGKYNVFVNGKLQSSAVPPMDIIDQARSAFDPEYRQLKASQATAMSMEAYKTQLTAGAKQAEQTAQMIREIAVERVKGNMGQALEMAKQMYGWDVRAVGDGTGNVIIRRGMDSYVFNPNKTATVSPDGITIPAGQATKITLPR